MLQIDCIDLYPYLHSENCCFTSDMDMCTSGPMYKLCALALAIVCSVACIPSVCLQLNLIYYLQIAFLLIHSPRVHSPKAVTAVRVCVCIDASMVRPM